MALTDSQKAHPTPKRWATLHAQRPLTRGERMCAFIEQFCLAPEGTHVGKPLVLDPFEERFIREVYDNPHGTSLGILSMAKKNGKTALIACVVIGHLVGPEAVQNSQIVCGAMSREQATIIFDYAAKMVRLSPLLSKVIRLVPSRKRMYGLLVNVEFRALAAIARTTHGISPIVAILDEIGQVRGPTSDFVDAIKTAQGAYDQGLLLVISTQAADDVDLLSLMIDDARTGEDPHTICHVYEAPKDCSVDDQAAWAAANPALGTFRSRKDLAKLAEQAKRMPSFTPTFRNLNLNQRVETQAPFVSRDVWKLNGTDPVPYELGHGDVFCGLDLSSTGDLTALVFEWEANGKRNYGCRFWLPEADLAERVKRDKAPYDVWAAQGLISLTPGRVVDYDQVAREFLEMAAGWNLGGVAFDRWRIEAFRSALARQDADPEVLEKFTGWGQGFRDMAPAIESLETGLLNEFIAHGNHPVLTMCASNARVVRDEAGNRKFDKRNPYRRIDGLVAMAMARGLAARHQPEETGLQFMFLGGAPKEKARAA